MAMIWSFVLTVLGCAALLLGGKGHKSGWLIGLLAQVLWATYSLVTKQYGFLIGCAAYGTVYYKNWRRRG